MSNFLQTIFAGLGSGAVYAIVALGFSIIYKVTKAINFAQGELLMVAGIVASILNVEHGWPLPLVAVVVIAMGGAMGVATDLVAVRFLRRPDPLTMTIGTVGVGIAIQAAVLLWTHGDSYSLPAFSGETPIDIGGALLQRQTLWNLGIAAVSVVALTLFFSRTRHGVSLRASADDRDTAAAFGVPFGSAARWGFGLAGALAAIAGLAITPVTLMSYNQGTSLALVGFAAAMLGGLGSMPGAVLGGLLVGVAETMAASYVTATYSSAAGFVILLAVLFTRPSGLFRTTAVERV